MPQSTVNGRCTDSVSPFVNLRAGILKEPEHLKSKHKGVDTQFLHKVANQVTLCTNNTNFTKIAIKSLFTPEDQKSTELGFSIDNASSKTVSMHTPAQPLVSV